MNTIMYLLQKHPDTSQLITHQLSYFQCVFCRQCDDFKRCVSFGTETASWCFISFFLILALKDTKAWCVISLRGHHTHTRGRNNESSICISFLCNKHRQPTVVGEDSGLIYRPHSGVNTNPAELMLIRVTPWNKYHTERFTVTMCHHPPTRTHSLISLQTLLIVPDDSRRLGVISQ